ncbi:hypothetical protein HMPREF2656_10265 [Corynebacterium sp. HMSC034B08]|nr:hypothetical protein HMPREF2656_10265 [Corynebacterium sp. HMSC034B08]PLA27156.1 hypothetical protein CYJ45_10275 [Corynebacterium coyleae]
MERRLIVDPYDAEQHLMEEFGVEDRHPANELRSVYLLGDFVDACELGVVPDKEIKKSYLALWEDPDEWFDDSLFTIPAVELLYTGVRQFAAMEPPVDVNLPSIKTLFPDGDS